MTVRQTLEKCVTIAVSRNFTDTTKIESIVYDYVSKNVHVQKRSKVYVIAL